MDAGVKTTILPSSAVLAQLLGRCSFEMTARDRAALRTAAEIISPGAEIFVVNRPNDALGMLVEAAIEVRRNGFVPVPHVVARNVPDERALDGLLSRLSEEAGVDRVLLLGGDRDRPAGIFTAALEVLHTNLLQKHGIARVAFACYPEGHPRIPTEVLGTALAEKLAFARHNGLQGMLISQFAFDAGRILEMAQQLRQSGASEPLRIGLAGPVNHAKLLKYALLCGVGPSLRILRDRKDLAFGILSSETPDALVAEISAQQALDPTLGIDGIHLFTFGALAEFCSLGAGAAGRAGRNQAPARARALRK